MRTVFISYSHQDKDLLPSLLAQLKALEQVGLLDVWVDTRIDAGEKWYPEIEAAMRRAAVAVCLVSEHFLASDFCTKEEVPFLMKRAAEEGLLVIPVLLSDCPWYAHRWVEERQMLPGGGQCVRTHFANNPAAVFSRVARRIFDKLNDPAFQPPPSRVRWPALPPDRLDLSRLPETGSALFGRDTELKLLDAAWKSGSVELTPGTKTAVRILAFKAQGGVGKSALINRWLAEMRRDNFRGATRVFGWSFYSQGVREQGAASADSFLAAALRFFGDEAMAGSAASAWDKGARLAKLVGAERALLVLDGMEPLQSAHWVDRGKLRDPGLEALLRGLARQSAGLCIITTREPLAELGKKPGIVERDLEQITPQAARALMRAAHIVGTDAELEQLAERFGPHALAISLLAVYLHEQPGHGLGPAKQLEQQPGEEPVDRVLAGFEKMLANSAELEALRLLGFFDRPADEGCLRALRAKPAIPGLTDRLAGSSDEDWKRLLARLEKLRLVHVRHTEAGKELVDAHPLIREHFAAELKEGSAGVSPAAVGVSPTASSPPISSPAGSQGTDASQRDAGLSTRDARAPQDAWREGHRRLYEYLCASTPDKPQPTLEDLQPLYQAVAHGCQAGLQQEADHKVYDARIQRGEKAYSTTRLGAFGSDLGAIAFFFENPWNRVSPALNEAEQAWLLNEAAYRLRALGRPTEAFEPMRAGLEMRVKQESWNNAARSANNLSELELTLGEVAGAVGDAEQSVTYADRSGDAGMRMIMRTTHADALHHAGRRAKAEARFREAEEMQAKNQREYPLLYSVQSFQYCDLLLAEAERAAWQVVLGSAGVPPATFGVSPEASAVQDQSARTPTGSDRDSRAPLIAACRAVEQRAAQTLKWVTTQNWLLDIALDHLTLGRAALYRAILEKSPIRNPQSAIELAVSGLRRAGDTARLPLGLFTRAWLRFVAGDATGAQSDLDEAWEIAERGPMKLHMADIHLFRPRLFRGQRAEDRGQPTEGGNEKYPWGSPEADLAAAEKLINECGYHRRDGELADAKRAILT